MRALAATCASIVRSELRSAYAARLIACYEQTCAECCNARDKAMPQFGGAISSLRASLMSMLSPPAYAPGGAPMLNYMRGFFQCAQRSWAGGSGRGCAIADEESGRAPSGTVRGLAAVLFSGLAFWLRSAPSRSGESGPTALRVMRAIPRPVLCPGMLLIAGRPSLGSAPGDAPQGLWARRPPESGLHGESEKTADARRSPAGAWPG